MSSTIREVAKKAKVSVATVSRVLNDSPLVKTDTREHVLKIVRELGYFPNVFARGLSKNKTEIIGLVVPPSPFLFSAYYFNEILRGVEFEASKNNYRLLISVDQSGFEKSQVANLFNQRQVDGLIIVAIPLDALEKSGLEKRKIPLVLISTHSPQFNCVYADNIEGAVCATQHLIGLGHRRIAIINGVMSGSDAQERFKGYKEALVKNNIEYRQELVRVGNFRQEEAYKAMEELLGLKPPPTAIFAANDLMAIGAMKAIKEKGMHIPQDISIVGFDDIDLASFIDPPLTTIRQPMFDIGKVAVESLIDIMDKKQAKTVQKALKTELVIRESTTKYNK
jgi:DNA-binding LacI/PurR family transcriptional regulator